MADGDASPPSSERRFRFVHRWFVQASPQAVFDALSDTEDWPRWWPAIDRVEPVDGDAAPDQRFAVRAPLAYRLHVDVTFVTLQRPGRIVAHLRGDLDGTATSDHEAVRGGTNVRQILDADAPAWWMRLPFLRPLLVVAHHRAVEGAREGLAAKLDTDVLRR